VVGAKGIVRGDLGVLGGVCNSKTYLCSSFNICSCVQYSVINVLQVSYLLIYLCLKKNYGKK